MADTKRPTPDGGAAESVRAPRAPKTPPSTVATIEEWAKIKEIEPVWVGAALPLRPGWVASTPVDEDEFDAAIDDAQKTESR